MKVLVDSSIWIGYFRLIEYPISVLGIKTMETEIEEDEEREHRIAMEAIVDAYDSVEQIMGWFYYLEGKIQFPFQARCVDRRRISPLKLGKRLPSTAWQRKMTARATCLLISNCWVGGLGFRCRS